MLKYSRTHSPCAPPRRHMHTHALSLSPSSHLTNKLVQAAPSSPSASIPFIRNPGCKLSSEAMLPNIGLNVLLTKLVHVTIAIFAHSVLSSPSSPIWLLKSQTVSLSYVKLLQYYHKTNQPVVFAVSRHLVATETNC